MVKKGKSLKSESGRKPEKHEILRILIENRGERFSIRKLSLVRKINYKSAYNAVMALNNEKIVDVEKIGNTLNCSFIRKFNPLVFEVEYARREELLKDKNFKVIYARLKILNFPFIALLFGSVVKNLAKKYSDIDMLVVTENPKEIEREISLIPLDIHPTTINYKDFIAMARSKEFSVVAEAIKKNIVINGIEEYYRIIENAG